MKAVVTRRTIKDSAIMALKSGVSVKQVKAQLFNRPSRICVTASSREGVIELLK